MCAGGAAGRGAVSEEMVTVFNDQWYMDLFICLDGNSVTLCVKHFH